jgi:hypothetical protein
VTARELTYFPVTGFFDTTVNGVMVNFDATVVCTPRLPAGFTALISNLDIGGGVGAPTALAFPPQVFTTTGGVLSGHLLANDPTVLGPVLAAAGITQLWYDISFTQVSLGYQIQNFSFPAPTTTAGVSFTDPTVTRYAYGGVVPTVSLPSGITAFGVQLLGAANESAAQTLLGIAGGGGYLGTVTSQAAMLALSAATAGSYCYRSDVATFYYLTATPPATLGNWASAETLPAALLAVPVEPVAVQTSAYTAAPGQIVPCNATSAPFTVTLPTAPVDGAQIIIKKIDVSTNAVTFACGGSDVFNVAAGSTTGTLVLQHQAVRLQYYAASHIWYALSTDAPLTQLDARYGVATTTGLTLVTAASVAAAQAALSLTPGTNVQPYNAATYLTGGALGTPSSGVLTNLTGSPTLTAPTISSPTFTGTGIPNAAIQQAGINNFNVALQSQVVASGTAYYITNSSLTMPAAALNGMTANKTAFVWNVAMAKTAAGTGIFQIAIYRGTNGTTADTQDVLATIGTQTAVIDEMVLNVMLVVTTTGATGSYYWSIIPDNRASLTVTANTPASAAGFGVPLQGSNAYLNGTVSSVAMNTASLKFGLGFVATTGTPTITIPQVQAFAFNMD